MELRHYQEQALFEASSHFKAGRKRVVICLPAGAGKTKTAAEAARRAVNKGSKVLWLAHRDELVDQGARELFRMTGVRPGIIQASKKADAKSDIQVASIQTLARRETMPPADIVIVDEAHHFLADSWAKVLSAYDGKFFLLLSATPARGDGRPMGDIADEIVAPIQPAQLISEGALVPCEIIAPSGTVLKGLAVDPVDAYVQWGKSKRAVVFAQTKEHAKQIRNGFIARDIPAAMVCDDTPSDQRKLIYKGIADGSIKVLVNVFIATEGLDIPSLEVCIIARTMGNATMFIQSAGRVMRPSPGKGSGLLIDLKGLVEKYGSPENDRHYFLEGDEAVQMEMGEAQRRKMTCASCGSIRTGSVCPVCALATVSERSMLPEVEGVRLVAKVQLDRSDSAKHEYIRLVDEYRLARKQNFPARANEDFRARRGTRPDPTWLEEYGRYLNGHFRKNPLPSWWPDQVREPHLVHPANAEAAPVAAELGKRHHVVQRLTFRSPRFQRDHHHRHGGRRFLPPRPGQRPDRQDRGLPQPHRHGSRRGPQRHEGDDRPEAVRVAGVHREDQGLPAPPDPHRGHPALQGHRPRRRATPAGLPQGSGRHP